MKYLSVLFCIAMLTSCIRQSYDNILKVEGFVKNIPSDKVYLTEAHKWDVFLDSAIYEKNTFSFSIKIDSTFEPFMASIQYVDESGNIKPLILNPDPGKSNNLETAFFLERGLTTIEGDMNTAEKLTVHAGEETQLFFQYRFRNFGYLGKIDSGLRKSKIAQYSDIIKKHSGSYFLLQSIFHNREQYSKKELQNLISFFTNDIQNSAIAEKLKTYIINRLESYESISGLSFLTDYGVDKPIVDTSKKLNMIIFWASWCGPCRKEIPDLKEIYKKFKQEVNFSSVSIDNNKLVWQKALTLEKMEWDQFIVDSMEIEKVMAQLNFSAVPVTVITDNNGRILQRFEGYNNSQRDLYIKVFNDYLVKVNRKEFPDRNQ